MQILNLLISFLLLAIMACKSQTTTRPIPQGASGTPSHLTIDQLQQSGMQVEDPYFLHTTDTVSARGPKSITRNALQDKNGHMWFATWQGIIQFDGSHFINHTLKHNLRKFHVFSVLEDRSGNMWFGTIRGGLYRYDPVAATKRRPPFTLFTTNEGLADDMVLSMIQDRDGNIWFGTNDGVSRYDPAKDTFTTFTTDDGLCGTEINSIYQDTKGRIWFGTRGGEQGNACYYSDGKFTNVNPSDDSHFNNVRSIIEDKTGTIWIGGQSGLWKYETGSNTLSKVVPNFIGYIFEDRSGIIWVSHGDAQGMSLSRLGTQAASNLEALNTVHYDSQVFGITQDRVGDIWFGTPGGVYRYDGKNVTGFSE